MISILPLSFTRFFTVCKLFSKSRVVKGQFLILLRIITWKTPIIFDDLIHKSIKMGNADPDTRTIKHGCTGIRLPCTDSAFIWLVRQCSFESKSGLSSRFLQCFESIIAIFLRRFKLIWKLKYLFITHLNWKREKEKTIRRAI